MILRHLTEALRRQDWGTVLVEIMIVVLGVFIGIQVANWNEERSDRRLGEDYRQRLIEDLQKDLSRLRGRETYYNIVLESVREANRLLQTPSPDPMALVKAAYRASEVNYDPPTRATWDQIVSSGDIGLLPRDAAGQLAEYFAFDFAREANDLLVDSGYRKQVRRLVPMHVQEAIREGCSDIRSETALIVGFVPECVIDVDGAALQETADVLQSDPDLLSLLNWHYSHAWSAAINSSGIAIQVSQALDALGAEKMVPEAKGEEGP